MSTDTELQTRAAALSREIATAGVSFYAALKDAPADAQPLLKRGEALTAEHTRRTRAGVRVALNSDDFDSRRLTFYADMVAHLQSTNTASRATAVDMASMLARAVSLLTEMGDALTAPERLAAERERVEAEAERERVEAPGKYLAKLKADGESLQRMREAAARSAPAPAAGLAGRLEW